MNYWFLKATRKKYQTRVDLQFKYNETSSPEHFTNPLTDRHIIKSIIQCKKNF